MDGAPFKHILLLERSAVHQLVLEELEDMGYRVSVAPDAAAARAALAHGDVDLLVADSARVGGDALGVAAHAASAAVPCVLMSGARVAGRSSGDHLTTFVDRPFTLEQVGGKVAEALAARPVPAGVR